MASDESAAVRPGVAVALRDVDAATAVPLLVKLAAGFDGQDRTYLSAWGIGATGKTEALAAAMTSPAHLGVSPEAYVDLLFTLTVESEWPRFKKRAPDDSLPLAERLQAVTALGFNANADAAASMLDIHERSTGLVKDNALWWILNHMNLRWAHTDLAAKVKAAGIYDPANVSVVPSIIPEADPEARLDVNEILALRGDATAGADKVAACRLCHVVGSEGPDYGPSLNGWVARSGIEETIRAIIDPSRDIAHGYDGRDVVLTDDTHVHGLVLAQADPVVVRSMGGLTQMIPKDRVKAIRWYGRSLMLSADQLGLSPQDVADITAYLATQ